MFGGSRDKSFGFGWQEEQRPPMWPLRQDEMRFGTPPLAGSIPQHCSKWFDDLAREGCWAGVGLEELAAKPGQRILADS